MTASRPTPSRAGTYAVALVVLGLLAWLGYRLVAGSERHSYAAGAAAPGYVALTAGHTYSVATHGGVTTEAARGLNPARLTCTAIAPSGARTALRITTESADTKATNQIATFVAPATGRVEVRCSGLSRVFVDDADDADFDLSGLLLVVVTGSVAVGLPLALSVARRRTDPSEPAGSQPVAA